MSYRTKISFLMYEDDTNTTLHFSLEYFKTQSREVAIITHG